MGDTDPMAGPEGTPCGTCGNLIRRWPNPYPELRAVREAAATMMRLVDALNEEDEAAFSYSFHLHGRRADGTFWPETTDDDYYSIEAKCQQIREAVDAIERRAHDVYVAIGLDGVHGTGTGPYTMRFPWGPQEGQAEKELHPS
jgi:hypothetical protein